MYRFFESWKRDSSKNHGSSLKFRTTAGSSCSGITIASKNLTQILNIEFKRNLPLLFRKYIKILIVISKGKRNKRDVGSAHFKVTLL
jgi:hypothetical protein